MKRKLWLITGILLLFIGCDTYYMVCSLNPFYIEKNIVLSPGIEGSWFAKPVKSVKDSANSPGSAIWGRADTTSTWTIKRHISRMVVKTKKGKDSTTFKPDNYYIAELFPPADSALYTFKVVIFKVNNGLYADFIPAAKEELFKSKLTSNSFFEVHTLARMIQVHDQLEISWLGADCIKKMIEKKRVRVNYQWVKETGRFLLTASSHDLTGMIERYGCQPRFINWDAQQARMKLKRLK